MWDHDEHLRNLYDFREWVPMRDEQGNELTGIEGKRGVRGEKVDGSHIGADFIRMAPGSRFPLHTHAGDHELYVIEGEGIVTVDGQDIRIHRGDLIHIPAEYPHAVFASLFYQGPLIFVAVGHPHRAIGATDRMRVVEVEPAGPQSQARPARTFR
jgi:quercetin dioxygenase-like cupin family protein